jgi:hypothetical protein
VATGRVSAEEIELVGGRVGSFEISIDGTLKYSKLKTRRFPTESATDGLV